MYLKLRILVCLDDIVKFMIACDRLSEFPLGSLQDASVTSIRVAGIPGKLSPGQYFLIFPYCVAMLPPSHANRVSSSRLVWENF